MDDTCMLMLELADGTLARFVSVLVPSRGEALARGLRRSRHFSLSDNQKDYVHGFRLGGTKGQPLLRCKFQASRLPQTYT